GRNRSRLRVHPNGADEASSSPSRADRPAHRRVEELARFSQRQNQAAGIQYGEHDPRSALPMPAVTTDAMETNTMESTVNTTTRETAGKAPATENRVESTMMKVVMMKEPEAEPYRYAVGVIRQ